MRQVRIRRTARRRPTEEDIAEPTSRRAEAGPLEALLERIEAALTR